MQMAPRIANGTEPWLRPANGGRSPAFTLLEMLMVIAIIGLLSSLVLAALSQAKQAAKKSQCLNIHRQSALAVLLYVGDHHRYIPYLDRDKSEFAAYKNKLIDACPNVIGVGYLYNGWGSGGRFTPESFGLMEASPPGSKSTTPGLPESKILVPSDMLMYLDTTSLSVPPRMRNDRVLEYTNFPHNGAINVSYCDGHAGPLKKRELEKPTEIIKVKYNNDHLPHDDTWQ